MTWRLSKSLEQLLKEVDEYAPQRSKVADCTIGGDAARRKKGRYPDPGASDHNECRCHDVVCGIDITHDPKGGLNAYRLAEWLRRRVYVESEPRIKYVISNGHIFGGQDQEYPGLWRKYTGSNSHDQHIHISVAHGPQLFDSTKKWHVSEGLPKVCPTCGRPFP